MEIQEFVKDARVGGFFKDNWGSDFIVSGENVLYGKDLPGLMIEDNGKIIGLLTYHLDGNSCEIVSLDSLREKNGIGTALIEKMVSIAKDKGFSRLWLMTTNDNIDAMKFYQKRGFILVRINVNAIEKGRQLKQEIPEFGNYGIPIRDEIELAYPI